jgi:hypothetical protein
MNTNSPIDPGLPVDRNQNIETQRTGKAGRPLKTAEAPKQAPVPEETQQVTVDTYLTSKEPKVVEELTRTVENMEESPREEVIARVSERIQSSYYTNPEIMNLLAVKLVNADLTRI